MITRTPAWAVGMEKLMPGVYARDDELHFCIPEICEAAGVECNEHNAQMLMHATREAFRRLSSEGPIEFEEAP